MKVKYYLILCLILILSVSFSSCIIPKRFISYYDSEFEYSDLFETSLKDNFEEIISCAVTRNYHYDSPLFSVKCDIYVDSKTDLDMAEKAVGVVSHVLNEHADVYDYFYKNHLELSVNFYVGKADKYNLSYYTNDYYNYEDWPAIHDAPNLYFPLTETVKGSLVFNSKTIETDVHINSYTAGFVLPFTYSLELLEVDYTREDGMIVISNGTRSIEMEFEDYPRYKYSISSEDVSYGNNVVTSDHCIEYKEVNAGFYQWKTCVCSENEMYMDNTSFLFLLKCLGYDNVSVNIDYESLICSFEV